jgi:ribose 5-phosphate isomerase B
MHEQRGRTAPSADEVRDIVRRIVDAALAGGGTTTPAIPGTAPLVDAGPEGAVAPGAAVAPGGAVAPEVASDGVPASGPAPGEAPAGANQVAIAIGADHGGSALKDRIGEMLAATGYAVHDCGTHGTEPVDYPDIAGAVAVLVARGTCRWGVIVDGAGIGSCMVANKVPGVRAALCHDLSSARNSREHNHANVLTLGARFTGEGLALEIVRAWLGTEWGPGRHAARVAKITDIERRYMKSPGEVAAG